MLDSSQSLREILEQALLSQAAYAQLSGVQFGDDALFRARLAQLDPNSGEPYMSQYAARYLAERYGVLYHKPNTDSGYSATLFARRSPEDPSAFSNLFTYAIRGTEFSGQFWDDIVDADVSQIGFGGQAAGQQSDMISDWTAISQGTAGYPNEQTIQTLIAQNRVNVTGHSLGGHLASLFANFYSPTTYNHVFTYNNPGVQWEGLALGLIAAAAWSHMREFFGYAGVVGAPGISNFLGDSKPDIIAGVHTLYGSADRVFTEDAPLLNPVREHSIVNMASGIAATYLLTLIDPLLAVANDELETVKGILKAVTNDTLQSYEAFATTLQRTFGIAPLPSETDGDGTIFTLIDEFENPAGEGGRTSGQLISLVSLPFETLTQTALANTPQGSALRFALVHSLPFAVVGAGAVNQGSEYAAEGFSEEYVQDRITYVRALLDRNAGDRVVGWSVDPFVTYEDRTTGTVAFASGESPVPTDPLVIFGDHTADETITGDNYGDRIYGGGGNDTLIGGDGRDYLDGGAGNDILVGGTGATTAAGGTGDDIYRYYTGDGALTIRDDSGEDRVSVHMGAAAMYLLGDYDVRRASFGQPLYTDSRGNRFALASTTLAVQLEDGGHITIENFEDGDFGIDLMEAEPPPPPTGPVTYNVGAPNQIITYPQIINGDRSAYDSVVNAIGLYWSHGPGPEPNVWDSAGNRFHRRDTEIINVMAAIDDPANNQRIDAVTQAGMGDSYITGDDGFNVLRDDMEAHQDDAVSAGSIWPGTGLGIYPVSETVALGIWGPGYSMASDMGDDHIDAGGGNDIVYTSGGDDTVHGGAGEDWLIDTHAGAEALFTESYTYNGITGQGITRFYDWISTEWVDRPGHTSNDQLFGEAGNDRIFAHGGKQLLDGGTENDIIYGGADGDMLEGGEGDDILAGDVFLTENPFTGSGIASDTASYGNDVLDGGAGDDHLYGGGGADTLIGGAGDDLLDGDFTVFPTLAADPVSHHGIDTILGGAGNDTVYGGWGADIIDGGAGVDTIYAGVGDDVVFGGTGTDTIYGDDATGLQGIDELHGGADQDFIYGGGGRDKLFGDAGADELHGGDSSDILEGGSETDNLYGDAGNDILRGGAGQDYLYGGDDTDQLESDGGDDLLFGGAGSDTYLLSLGAGVVQITDIEGTNTLKFSSGITAANLSLRMVGGQAIIDFSATDRVVMSVATFNTLTALQFGDLLDETLSIDELRHRFQPQPVADGSLQLLNGAAVGDISYTSLNFDLILGYAGPAPNWDWVDTSTLSARNVQFELKQGSAYGLPAGTRVLVLTNWYAADSSTYVHDLLGTNGGVADIVAAANTIARRYAGTDNGEVLGGSGAVNQLFGNGGDDMLVGADGADLLRGGTDDDAMLGGAGSDVYGISVGDGRDVVADTGGTSDAILFGTGINPVDVTINETTLGLHLQIGAVENGNSVDILASAGSPRPIERLQFGDGTVWDLEDIDEHITGNRAPRLEIPVPDRHSLPGQEFALGLPVGTFVDPNGDTLTYTGTLADGGPLPSWLALDSESGELLGTRPYDDLTVYNVRIVATDQDGLSGADEFAFGLGPNELLGTAASDSLTGTALDEVIAGRAGDDILSGGDGADDIFGESGTDILQAEAGDDQLTGGAGADTLSGGSGNDRYWYGAGDGADVIDEVSGTSDSLQFLSSVTPSDLTLTEVGDDLLVQIGPAANGDSVRLVDWMADPGARAESFVFTSSSWSSVVEIESYITGNRAPRLETLVPDRHALPGQGFTFGLPAGTFVDPNGDTVTYTGTLANGSPLPSWLTLDSLSGELLGTRPYDDLAVYSVRIIATDPAGLSRSDEFTFGLSANQTLGTALADSITGTSLDDVIAGRAGDDVVSGGDGSDYIYGEAGSDTLQGEVGDDQLAGGAGTDTLSGGSGNDRYFYGAGDGADVIDEASGTSDALQFLSSVAASDLTLTEVGDDLIVRIGPAGNGDSVTIVDWMTDPGARIETFDFTSGSWSGVAEIESHITGNRAPRLTGSVPNQVAVAGSAYAYVIPAGTFTDPNPSDVLAYDVTLADGSPLPEWLDFDAVTHTLSGNPLNENSATMMLRARATDAAGLYAETTFELRVPQLITMNGTSSADTLTATTGDHYRLYGFDGWDQLNGNAGDDLLDGGEGNDTLTGNAGNDRLIGGVNDDALSGGAGSDTYVYNLGDGNDHISSARDAGAGSVDAIEFGVGIDPANVLLRRVYPDDIEFQLRDPSTGATTTIVTAGDGFNVSYGHEILDEVRFATGIVWSREDLYTRYLIGTDSAETKSGFDNRNDLINGYGGDDTLSGGSGNDDISGGTGSDTLDGGGGDDAFRFGSGDGHDEISDTSGNNRIVLGPDITPAQVSLYRTSSATKLGGDTSDAFVIALASGQQIWVKNFFGGQTPRPINEIQFSDGTIWNASTIDTLLINNAGTADTVTGTSGSDAHAVDHRADVINEAANGGTDTVTSSVSYTLGGNIENLTLAVGSLDIRATGNSLNNTLIGNAGANVLEGKTGTDTMTGGLGDDTYYADTTHTNFFWESSPELWNFLDVVVEQGGEGYDTVVAENVYSATMQANVEKMVVSGIVSGTISFNLTQDVRRKFTGNALDNVIDTTLASQVGVGVGQVFVGSGAGGEIVIDGGAGADLMIGGAGLKTRFIVDNVNDVVVANTGADTVVTPFAYTLGYQVENAELSGTAAVALTGNSFSNRLSGAQNTAANVLTGGAGNDTYVLGAGDTAIEIAAEGTDSIETSQTYALAANFENLTLLGTTAISATGNAVANVLRGNTGANVLDGGAGNDQLIGDTGNDRYLGFGAGSGIDVISDVGGADTLEFSSVQNTQIEQLQFSLVGNSLLVTINAQDSITIQNWATTANQLEELQLWEGGLLYRYTKAQVIARYTGVNSAPVANWFVTAADAMATQAYSFQVPGNIFSDSESQHSLTYAATLSDGSALPSWLHFDSATRTFTGTPTSLDTTLLSLRLTATDAGSLSANTTFSLAVTPFTLNGTSGDDVLNGDAGGNIVNGLGGNDTIHGLGGDDDLHGDDGNDTVFGDAGVDYLSGGNNDDLLYGGSEDDTIDGDAGNDTLDGGTGADSLRGGIGNDIYVIDVAGDSVNENASEGTDTVQSSITYTLGSNLENLTLTGSGTIGGTGNTLANTIIGNGANNTLSGGSGDDVLDGGAGNDGMTGGQGNDSFYVDSTTDSTTESSGQGTDTVYSSVNWTLASNLENLVLTGTGNVSGTGNTASNTITGNSGNNALSGGTGADTMLGGAGNDTYTVDNTGDVVTEAANEGTDLVNSSVTYTIGNNVENLTLTLTSTINGTGNGLDNILIGNSANNTLTGHGGNDTIDGGGGNDTMVGGAGNDAYTLAQTLDVVTELANEGTDLVFSSVNHTLGSHVENLTLTGTSGLSGTGNTLDNVITGNSGANTLSGGDGNDTLNGGTGADPMTGGLGNDVFYVDVAGDGTTEAANQGFDTIMSSMTRTLVANIEALFLTGSSAINATGLTTANLLRGNIGTNTLSGAGGTDILEGLAGTDTLQNLVSANTLMNGGADNDTLTGTANNDMLIGGTGNDSITTGQGADIIVFNQGEGQDTVAPSTTKDNTLALGGGLVYADLLFQKSGNNLILKTGGTDQITFTNYYASASNRSVDKLQIVIEDTSDYIPGGDAQHNKKIATFNFDGLVTAFDAARAANPSLTTWALTNALVAQHLGGSDTAAIGGDLAYRYGRFDSMSGISFTPALALLAAAGFGSSAQNLQSLATLQDSSPRLS